MSLEEVTYEETTRTISLSTTAVIEHTIPTLIQEQLQQYLSQFKKRNNKNQKKKNNIINSNKMKEEQDKL